VKVPPPESTSDPKEKPPEEKINVMQKDIAVYITIEIVMMGFEVKTITQSKVRVHIEEKLSSVFESIEILNQLKVLPIY
jgi:hypothetical protein